jgi:hypothetical protein
MLNNIIIYIEKNKIVFTIIVIFLFIVLIITYKKNYDNFENVNTKLEINPESENIPLDIDPIIFPNIIGTNMLFTSNTLNDTQGNNITKDYYLGIYKMNECNNLNSENHIPECTSNIPILIPIDIYNIMKAKYVYDKNNYDKLCHNLCSENNSEQCNCPTMNLQYIVDFNIIKGTMPNRYIISGKQRDTIDNNNFIKGNNFLLSNNLYNQEHQNEFYRHICFDDTTGGTEETEIIFEPSDEPIKFYIVFTKTNNDNTVEKLYVGQTNIDVYNKCLTGIFKFNRLALYPNKQQALKFTLL